HRAVDGAIDEVLEIEGLRALLQAGGDFFRVVLVLVGFTALGPGAGHGRGSGRVEAPILAACRAPRPVGACGGQGASISSMVRGPALRWNGPARVSRSP